MNKKYVLTGVAGSGKSTIINELRKLGYPVTDEAARQLIMRLQDEDPSLLPWNNRLAFQELAENLQFDNYNQFSGFFDRSIIDEIAYRRFNDVDVPTHLIAMCNHCRHDEIFIFPPFKEIYSSDNVRVDTFEESASMYPYLLEGYEMFGYKPIVVEKDSIENRIEFILNNIK